MNRFNARSWNFRFLLVERNLNFKIKKKTPNMSSENEYFSWLWFRLKNIASPQDHWKPLKLKQYIVRMMDLSSFELGNKTHPFFSSLISTGSFLEMFNSFAIVSVSCSLMFSIVSGSNSGTFVSSSASLSLSFLRFRFFSFDTEPSTM